MYNFSKCKIVNGVDSYSEYFLNHQPTVFVYIGSKRKHNHITCVETVNTLSADGIPNYILISIIIILGLNK